MNPKTNGEKLLKWLRKSGEKGLTYQQILNQSGWNVNYLSGLIKSLIAKGYNIRKEQEAVESPTQGGQRYLKRVYLNTPEQGVSVVITSPVMMKVIEMLAKYPKATKYLVENPEVLKQLETSTMLS